MTNQPESPEAAANRERIAKLQSLNLTDAGNAEAFALLNGHQFRFDCNQGRFVAWNERYWALDDVAECERAALQTARARLIAAALIQDKEDRECQTKWALHSESAYGIKAMLRSVQSIRGIATRVTDYDRDPFLLTVGNGTLDLRTGRLRECRPADLITRATNIKFSPLTQCPRWTQFLHEIFLGDQKLIEFVRRAVGYSLTGDVREQCLFILYGGGANGKSTFLEILLKLVGTHAAVTSFSTFLIHTTPGAPRNDVAKLHGARLVKAAESQREAALDEATVKEVTGGDTISARFLFREFFDFKPQFKIWLATNHRPAIHGTDDAIWRRIRLIPFNQQFMGRRQDPKLREKLEAELSGILGWAVSGCLEWQRIGLGVAPAIATATLNYRRESDHVGRFLGERCTSRRQDHSPGKELFEAYVQWCGQAGERPESNNIFAKALAERGIRKKRTRAGTVYEGIGLRPQSKQPNPIPRVPP
jgi:putative DNA primase/helicase